MRAGNRSENIFNENERTHTIAVRFGLAEEPLVFLDSRFPRASDRDIFLWMTEESVEIFEYVTRLEWKKKERGVRESIHEPSLIISRLVDEYLFGRRIVWTVARGLNAFTNAASK